MGAFIIGVAAFFFSLVTSGAEERHSSELMPPEFNRQALFFNIFNAAILGGTLYFISAAVGMYCKIPFLYEW